MEVKPITPEEFESRMKKIKKSFRRPLRREACVPVMTDRAWPIM